MQRRQFLRGGVSIAIGAAVLDRIGSPAANAIDLTAGPRADAAARAAGEPTLTELCGRLGYGGTNTSASSAIRAFQFRKAQPGMVRSYPLAAYGQPKECASGWYAADNPDKRITLWKVDGRHQKEDNPPTEGKSIITFDPKDKPFGLWLASKSFSGENVDTDDGRNAAIARFGGVAIRKVRIYAAVSSNGGAIPNSYLLGWEYSTGDDFQDMVTVLENVQPLVAPTTTADAPPSPAMPAIKPASQ